MGCMPTWQRWIMRGSKKSLRRKSLHFDDLTKVNFYSRYFVAGRYLPRMRFLKKWLPPTRRPGHDAVSRYHESRTFLLLCVLQSDLSVDAHPGTEDERCPPAAAGEHP